MLKKSTQKGFTLIELLVVISIIGLLSSVVLSSLNTARSKGRDAQRISDLTQLQKALALYYDQNGRYPNTSGFCTSYDECSSAQGAWSSTDIAVNPLYAVVAGGFISKLPIDPKNTPANNVLQTTASDYSYYYSTSGTNQTYDLVARLENAGNPNSCQIKDTAYCDSVVWAGWNWGADSPAGDRLVYYHP
ncbi:MAG: hypothetical protein A2408_00825 [Candidatus Yonathbacteria bacterium RIFOXYC1_FULL_52_10]|uniref:Type II secretion system protein GspG C-terminal domain-containing protein n=1 Tax=Candidatus Yonathbacteria bacterium RIFOXYD1_FULL_52_36 TaxID=1802730 RepID=A0A1G2SK72_9BACT|nr:MAG: hypothetical protein A2591_04100 [Candidatus Yonathbacteria bacterium RIFOXYD1_FULL_52_36]OHA85688.1 MAG: hypothetical protein A2408_00825 [Candidatus Yonathbacteria bacterium RIFOXYC1_FULL_52_10]